MCVKPSGFVRLLPSQRQGDRPQIQVLAGTNCKFFWQLFSGRHFKGGQGAPSAAVLNWCSVHVSGLAERAQGSPAPIWSRRDFFGQLQHSIKGYVSNTH